MNKNKWIYLLAFLFCIFMQPIQAEGNFVESDLFGSMQTGDKAALLVVHFGTTHDDTRALTIDAVNKKMTETFPSLDFPYHRVPPENTGHLQIESGRSTRPVESRRIYTCADPVVQHHRRDRDGVTTKRCSHT